MNPIEELALIGSLREEKVILGKKFVWHTLDGNDLIAATFSATMFDQKTREKMEQVEKLARAIETINGVSFTSLIKEGENVTPLQKAKELIFKWQDIVREHIYLEYKKLEEKQQKVVEELSKNGQSPITYATVGK